ncbi:MAG: response regulator transcription factor [Acidobacteria bacterium]|nr:MAG: response regulator transcription factor [Acidobacteriota bacterium]
MSAQVNIFLLAQNRLLLEALARILQKRAEFSVVHATAYSSECVNIINDLDSELLVIDSSVADAFGFQVVQDTLGSVDGLKALMIGMEEDEETFLKAVSAGASGYVLKDASAMDVVAAIRAIARDEAVCPPRLCRSLFRYVAGTCSGLPNMRVKSQLGLTRRQQQLVPLIAQGLTNKEIALQLNLSEQTIKNHVHRMLQKVGADDRLSVVEKVKVNQVFL